MTDPSLMRGQADRWSDATLLAAMRREDAEALAEFYSRHMPLLRRMARSWGLGLADAETAATDTLTDIAMTLMEPGTAAPRSLAAYLAAALRNRLGMERRAASRRAAHAVDMETVHDGTTPSRPTGPRAVAEPAVAITLCSSYALRASRAADDLDAPAAAALRRLVDRVESELRESDRLLLVWLAHHVPLRTIAEWQEVRYDTAVKRASRLRERLRAIVLAHIGALLPDDRRQLHRILERAGVVVTPSSRSSAVPAAADPTIQENDR